MTNLIVTEIDDFFALVKERGEITMEEVGQVMQHEVKVIERWAKALSEVGMMRVNYPVFHYDVGKAKLRVVDQVALQTSERVPVGMMLPSI